MKPKKKDIYESLQTQLSQKGNPPDHFIDLLNDYMSFWTLKNKLIKDIKKRGITYQDVSAAGKVMWKNNPSTKSLIDVNKQMLAILEKLDIKTDEMSDGEFGDL